jgi:predicted peroxiredoxin
MATLLIHCTHGSEDPERATLAFIVGNVAASADQDVVVLLTIEGVWLATPGYADDIHKEGFPALSEVMASFHTNGGRTWVCGTCAKPRNITEDRLIAGARIVTAANVVERLAAGATTLDF